MQLARHCARTFPFLAERPPVAFQRSPNRLPILRRGFQHCFLHLLLAQPLAKPLQLLGVATKPSPLEFVFALTLYVGYHYSQHLFVNVNSRYPISHGFLLGGKRRACHALHIQAHVAIAAPARGDSNAHSFAQLRMLRVRHGHSLNCSTMRSTSPLPVVSHCALALSDFHKVSRAVGPNWHGRKSSIAAADHIPRFDAVAVQPNARWDFGSR